MQVFSVFIQNIFMLVHVSNKLCMKKEDNKKLNMSLFKNVPQGKTNKQNQNSLDRSDIHVNTGF